MSIAMRESITGAQADALTGLPLPGHHQGVPRLCLPLRLLDPYGSPLLRRLLADPAEAGATYDRSRPGRWRGISRAAMHRGDRYDLGGRGTPVPQGLATHLPADAALIEVDLAVSLPVDPEQTTEAP